MKTATNCAQESAFETVMQDVYEKHMQHFLERYHIGLHHDVFRHDIHCDLGGIQRARELTGIEPNNSIIQRGHREFITRGDIGYAFELKEYTGVKPEDDLMQDAFSAQISKYVAASDRDHFRTRQDTLDDCLKRLGDLMKLGETKPPKDYAQATYAALLDKEAIKDAFALSECLGIGISYKVLKDAFTAYLVRGLRQPFASLQKRVEYTPDIAPDDEAVAFRYETEAKAGSMENLERLLAWKKLLGGEFPDEVKALIEEQYRWQLRDK